MVFTGSQQRSIEVAIQGDASSLRNAVDGAQEGLMNLRSTARLAGGALAALSAGGIAKSVQASAQLETALAEVSTLMADGESAASRYGDTVSRLSTQFALQGGQIEATEALYQTLSAGIAEAGNETAFLETAMRTARAGLTDTGTAVDALSTVVNAYRLEASEASRVSDILFETVRQGKTRMEELGSTIGRVVPTAAEMDVGIEELGAAIATLTAQGQSTDQAVTAVNRTLTSLLKPTGDAAEVIERMGFASGRALVEQEGLAGSLELLQEHAANSSDELTDVFGNVRALRAALPLANEASEDFNANLDAMANSAGATDAAFEEMADTTEFRFQQSLNELRSTLTQTGDSFMPTANDMLTGINDLATGFNELQRATDGAAGQLTLLAGLAGGVGLAFGSTAGAIAAAGAAALAAWSGDMAGIRSTTLRTLDDIEASLSGLTQATRDETEQQLSVWDRWEIRIAAGFDSIGTSIAQVIDDLVTLADIGGEAVSSIGDQIDAMAEGDMQAANERSRRARERMSEMIDDFQERRERRGEELQERQQQRRTAIAQDDRSALPRGVEESDDEDGTERLAEEYRREQEQTRAELSTILEDVREENRRTADATAETLGGGPCDLREHLLGPQERAPRPQAQPSDGGEQSRPGRQSSPDQRDSGVVAPRDVASSDTTEPGEQKVVLEIEGERFAEVVTQLQGRHIADDYIVE